MSPHVIKVALDKDVILHEFTIMNDSKTQSFLDRLFKGKKVRYITTFTSYSEHLRIKSALSSSLCEEEKILQLLFRKFEIANGQEVIDTLLAGGITKENVQQLPDLIISESSGSATQFQQVGIPIIQINGSLPQRTSLCHSIPLRYFKLMPYNTYWKIRIEDRYILKNLSTEEVVKRFFDGFSNNGRFHYMEIICSGKEYDYKDSLSRGFIDKQERARRMEMIRKVGSNYNIKFITTAGHDRYICTNSSLFILGNSITSDKETHITYFPLLEYYSQFFAIDNTMPLVN